MDLVLYFFTKGEGVKNLENFADVLYGWSHRHSKCEHEPPCTPPMALPRPIAPNVAASQGVRARGQKKPVFQT